MQSIFERAVSCISDITTIIVAGIAIGIFICKRKVIRTVFKALLHYSSQITLRELNTKIERLNDLNVEEPSQADKALNIFNEIVGQIRGNKGLKRTCSSVLKKLSLYEENPQRLTEPRKRGVISELREKLRHVDIENLEDFIGGNYE